MLYRRPVSAYLPARYKRNPCGDSTGGFEKGNTCGMPDWKKQKGADRVANDDDDAEPTKNQCDVVKAILGFDPDEIEHEDDHASH
jgi:hypothetical protein